MNEIFLDNLKSKDIGSTKQLKRLETALEQPGGSNLIIPAQLSKLTASGYERIRIVGKGILYKLISFLIKN